MPRRGIAAVCVLVAALLTAPAAAHAVTPNPFYGVVGVHVPNQAELDRVATAGAGTYRIQVDWRFIEPTPGVRNWAAADLLFAEAARAGISVLPDLLGVPRWVSHDRTRPPIYGTRQRAAWAALLSDLARRYGSNGTFWALHPELPRAPVTAWEIWQEPNRAAFFGGKPRPRGFARLLMLSSAALKAADASAQVVAGGIWPYRSNKNSLNLVDYLRALYRVPGASSAFDALAIHPVAAKPNGVLRLIRGTRRIMRARGDGAKPIWVTSFGWVTKGRGGLETPALRTTPREQATKLTAAFRLLAANANALGIDRALWYSLTDVSRKRAPDFFLGRAGLFTVRGAPKPSWFAFAAAAGGTP
jgi:polysaccharide biosynthesis protein PslG